MANERNKPDGTAPEALKAHQGDQSPTPTPSDLHSLVTQQAAMLEQMRKDNAELREIMMAVIRAQPKESPDSLWAKQHQKEMEIKENLDKLAEEFQKTCQQRTQAAANKLNPDVKRLFKVSMGWCPELVVRAQDEDIAKTRYNKLCGITAVNSIHAKPAGSTDYKVLDVTQDLAAQELINGVREWPNKKALAA